MPPNCVVIGRILLFFFYILNQNNIMSSNPLRNRAQAERKSESPPHNIEMDWMRWRALLRWRFFLRPAAVNASTFQIFEHDVHSFAN